MTSNRYSIQHKSVENILNLIDMKKIAIPELQRPFVWQTTKVRDLMDSLYKGYPIGYIITWENPDTRLKDGADSKGKTILIDGQQRVTALKAALHGQHVMDKNYNQIQIKIAFHPIKEQFETSTPAYVKDKEWISDISKIMDPDFSTYAYIEEYAQLNPDVDKDLLSKNIKNLTDIKTRTIGELEINSEVNVEIVDEIFIRINKSGTSLSEADFAMSKIAVFEIEPGDEYGVFLRKYFDYFCNALQSQDAIEKITTNDKAFKDRPELQKIKWVANAENLIYKPTYSDIIRTAGIIGLNRARLRDVVALLSGRNFEIKSFNREDSYLKSIADESFEKFKNAIEIIVNEYNYKRFEQDILRGCGFYNENMFGSMNVLNYTFAIYQKLLKLTDDYNLVRQLTRKFLVFSLLTEHHGGSFETRWEADFKQFDNISNVEKLIHSYENEQLSDVFWKTALPRELDKVANIKSPKWNLFVAAQNKLSKQSFLSDVEVKNMTITDLHHIFPKQYMKEAGLEKNQYNRLANFVILSRDINIKIGKTKPSKYLIHPKDFGSNITDIEKNLSDNCIPHKPELWKLENYEQFLKERTSLISELIKEYYESL